MKSFLKANKFSLTILGCMLVGGIVGAFWGKGADVLTPISDIFLHLLYCVVVPMIFISLVYSISKMANLRALGKLVVVMVIIFVLTQVIASVYMSGVCAVFNPAKGANVQLTAPQGDLTSNNNFLSMLTVSDFPQLFSRQSLMALIVFAILCGVAIVSVGEKGKAVVNLFASLQEVVMKMVGIIMYMAPIGLGLFFCTLIGDEGAQLAGPLARSIIIYLVAAAVYYVFGMTLFAFIGGGALGVRRYWANIATLSLMALGLSSSAACIPTSLVATKKIGVPDGVRDIAIPLGTNLHKDGACLITILKIYFMCSIFHISITPQIFLTAILVSVIASSVMGAIPEGGYVGEIFIMSAFHFPATAIPIMVLIGTITDAPATAINAASQPAMAMIVTRVMEGRDWLKHLVVKEAASVES